MKYFTLGWRRLYECVGCDIEDNMEIRSTTPFDVSGAITTYIGRSPKYGTTVPIIPNFPKVGVPVTVESVNHKGKVLLELTASHRRELSSQLERAFNSQDEQCIDKILAVVKDGSPYKYVLDAFAGAIGIFLDRQVVLSQLAQGEFFEYEGMWRAVSTSDGAEIVAALHIASESTVPLTAAVNQFSKLPLDTIAKMGGECHWLLKAWAEQDPIARFVYSFIPLEAMLPKTLPDDWVKNSSVKLRALACASENPAQLLQFLDAAEKKFGATLVDRFRAMAQLYEPEGWEADHELFKTLNRRRNTLLHQGRKLIDHATLNTQTKLLQDLAVKYIRKVYLSEV